VRTSRALRLLWLALAAALVLLSCNSDGGSATSLQQPGDLRIVATTSIAGDIVGGMGGERADVQVLIPNGSDPHDYAPSARQVALLQSADVVVAIGLGLEAGLGDVLEAAARDDVPVVELAEFAEPKPRGGSGDAGALDPHIWLDPIRVAAASRALGLELSTLDPSGGWAGLAEAYASQMEQLDRTIRTRLEAIAPEDRKLVTNHEALGYFAERYDFEIVGVVVPGGSTLAAPSSSQLAELVEAMRAEDVQAIFVETSAPATLADAVAAEVGADVLVIELFTAALGEPGSGADTLLGVLETDAARIAEALT